MNACPDPSRLMAYMDGELHGAEAADVRSHVESCAACRRIIDKQAIIEKSYRDSFETPSDESFRLMERRIMASVQAPARKRLPAFVPIAAALLIAAAGVRLAGRSGLLERPSVETITVTSERDRIEPGDSISGGSPAGAACESPASDSVSGQTVCFTEDALSLQDQQAASSEVERGYEEYPAMLAPPEDEDAQNVTGGTGGLATGAGGGAAVQNQAASTGLVGSVSQTVPGHGEGWYNLGDSAAGRICDADPGTGGIASDDSGFQTAPGAEGDLCVITVDVLARGSVAADRTVSACETQLEAAAPCPFEEAVSSAVLIIFDSEGEPASPDSVLLDTCFPGWKDSLAGSMLDTALVVTCEEFQDLVAEPGAH